MKDNSKQLPNFASQLYTSVITKDNLKKLLKEFKNA